MPYARSSDGIKLYYEEHGRTGTPLVLAYGIGGNTEMWDVNVAALSAAHRLILWEPRGHARSDSPEDPAKVSFARWALDLKDVLDHLRLRRAHVGGLSLGAGIATRFTLRFPARVRSLLITNSSSASGLPLSVDNLVMRAQSNAEGNGLSASTRFVQTDLFKLDADNLEQQGRFDRMLIDPPRDGAVALVKALSDDAPRRIVYVSCNSATLARDAGVLVHVKGYVLSAAGVINMFPHTSHVESIAVFDRQ